MKGKYYLSWKKKFISRKCLFWINKNSQSRKLTDILVSVTGSDQCSYGDLVQDSATSEINVLTLITGTQ